MGVFRAMGRGVASGFRVNRWLGTNRIKGSAKSVKEIATTLFDNEKAEEVKNLNFEECLKHYNMTEADLELRMKQAKKWVAFCLATTVLAFGYMFYEFHANELIATFVCFMIGVLTIAYAFREHFNLFQMRQRRLGCTVSEWFTSLISRGKK